MAWMYALRAPAHRIGMSHATCNASPQLTQVIVRTRLTEQVICFVYNIQTDSTGGSD